MSYSLTVVYIHMSIVDCGLFRICTFHRSVMLLSLTYQQQQLIKMSWMFRRFHLPRVKVCQYALKMCMLLSFSISNAGISSLKSIFYLQVLILIQKMVTKYFLVFLILLWEFNEVKQSPFLLYFPNLGNKKISVVFMLSLLWVPSFQKTLKCIIKASISWNHKCCFLVLISLFNRSKHG